MLASEGFNEARVMAKKTVTLYSLMVQQLSKQDHYDYGLRNLKAVLTMAGQLKRNDPTMAEDGGYSDEGRSSFPLLSLT